ncbi:aspartic peptidase domain-containing protein [Suillus bovinus]|uniref:aspartic peptidase domain-containing protein n=1 Tax=Suillus bovinus TaxID=48563 RepID=UPI001B8681A9|nr:aspartic peptidase domain-containing protein [Suillus bovinus]KAG2151653.1 aspartic peptidase domain-containing protein [Suillus bovinus]
MHKYVRSIVAAFILLYSVAAAELASRNSGHSPHVGKRMQDGLHLPLSRRLIPKRITLGADTGVAGLGDYFDVTYSVLIDIGGTSLPVVLDTGSSDLWVLSNICQGTCSSANTTLYPPNTFHDIGLDAALVYGDSKTGTYARGIVGYDAVSLAGLTLQDQYFAAINDTNTSVAQTRCSGIFGLGFPLNSVIWTDVFLNQRQVSRRRSLYRGAVSRIAAMRRNYAIRWFDKSFLGISSSRYTDPPSYQSMPQQKRQVTTSSTIISSFSVSGPFIPRLVSLGGLASPMFAIALQRDTIEIGGNEGMLSIGGLPPGVQNESLTWVSVRKYTLQQDGLPQGSSLESYPIAWEIPVDDVFLDGVKLPRSQLTSSNISLSALIDTGNSLIRGPPDVISYIQNMLGGPYFACSFPHTLAFQIGGRMFPVDPRDFINQVRSGNVQVCGANLAQTDVPVLGGGGYLYSWSLGDPFLKGFVVPDHSSIARVLAAFYYGSFTGLLQDPPRIGFLSTVPSDAGQRLEDAVLAASAEQYDLPGTNVLPPSSFYSPLSTGIGGIPMASPLSGSVHNVGGSNQAGQASGARDDMQNARMNVIFSLPMKRFHGFLPAIGLPRTWDWIDDRLSSWTDSFKPYPIHASEPAASYDIPESMLDLLVSRTASSPRPFRFPQQVLAYAYLPRTDQCPLTIMVSTSVEVANDQGRYQGVPGLVYPSDPVRGRRENTTKRIGVDVGKTRTRRSA